MHSIREQLWTPRMIKSAAGSAISCFKTEAALSLESGRTARLDSGAFRKTLGIIILPGTRSFNGEAKVWFPEPVKQPMAVRFRSLRLSVWIVAQTMGSDFRENFFLEFLE
jgi:hypothetical protein